MVELMEENALLREQNRLLAERNVELEIQIAGLREQINLLIAKRFGASSEKHSPDQLRLFDEAEKEAVEAVVEEDEETVEVSVHARQKPRRKPLPPELPRIEVVHDLPEAEKVCPHDGATLTRIGEEVSEQLDIVPAKIQVIRHVRVKYACPCCEGHVQRAPLPPQPIPKSNASPGLLAFIITSKFVDAMPLARQEKALARIGVELPRATLASWVIRCGELVLPLINLLRDDLLGYDLAQMDETIVQVLNEPGRAATTQSYMWVQRGGPPGQSVILFDYEPSRGGAVPLRLLDGFEGHLQCDGWDAYDAVGARPGVSLVGCWAHARRKFDEAVKAQGPKPKAGKATRGLVFIQRLYRVETLAKALEPAQRFELRQQQAKPILDEMRVWLDDSLGQVPPQSLTGKALTYLNNQWPKLVRYLDDGRIAIDNNAAERAIRPFVIGRRNWLFSDTPDGATASARLYSLIETAKANGLEPYAYLLRVFKELPAAKSLADFEALLPWNCTGAEITPA
ncbi:MAG TPA: IS66 family transposase [Opitutaceae bacterium]|nr:IS66 family transposase [Opitutaceae bacterium]